MVISVQPLSGTGAADYYLQRDAGCEARYYLDRTEAAGRWIGSGAARLDLVGGLDHTGERAFRSLLASAHPGSGEQLGRPVWRPDPAGRLRAGPLVDAIHATARTRGMTDPARLFDDERLADTYTGVAAAATRRPFVRALDPRVAVRLATAVGLDPVEVYRSPDGTDLFTPALVKAGDRYDAKNYGYDVCVSAPKSVSTLFAVADPQIAEATRAAHDAAVRVALDYLERETGHGLRGHQGDGQRAARVATDGLIGARFEHQTSRTNDPQLHTHVVITNLIHGVDGKWTALDSRALHRHATTASYLYHAALRGQLTQRLGVSWTAVEKGVAEIRDIPADLKGAFSTRRAAITAELATTGRDDPAAAQRACLNTRPVKQHADRDALRQAWRDTAHRLGHDPTTLVTHVVDRPLPDAVDVAQLTRTLTGPAGLTRQRTTVDRRDVLQAVCEALPPGSPVTLDYLDDLVDEITGGPTMQRIDRGPNDDPRFSTQELLAAEQRALELAEHLRRSTTGTTGLFIPPARTLSPEQRDLVARLLYDDRQLTVIVGPAGSGKTAALAAANRGWAAAGTPVYGAAVSALAARGLQRAAGITSTTLDRTLADLDRIDPRTGRPFGLQGGSVLVIDEAGMVDTRTLLRLLDHTRNSAANLVLVGDPKQLPEIGAGGLYAALTDHPATLRVTGNVRQHSQWERDALADLRTGRTAAALTEYLHHERIHVGANGHDVQTAIAVDYLRATSEPDAASDVIVLTATRTEAAAINQAIRGQLRESGHLDRDDLTVAARGGTVEFAVGDAVLVTRNHHRAGILNGTRGRVTDIDRATGSLRIVDTDGAEHHLDQRLLASGDVSHGYAMTIHKAQGVTVATALIAGTTTLTKEAGYVALSRGTTANHLYVTADDLTAACPNIHLRLAIYQEAATEALRQRLERSRAHQLALSLLRTPPARAEGRQSSPRYDREPPNQSRGISR